MPLWPEVPAYHLSGHLILPIGYLSFTGIPTMAIDVRHTTLRSPDITVNCWPQASKKSQNQLRTSKKDLNWSYWVIKHLGTFLITGFIVTMSPNVYERAEDKINENKSCQWIVCNVFSCYIKEKFVGPVTILQDLWILGVTGPMGPVTFWVECWGLLPLSYLCYLG